MPDLKDIVIAEITAGGPITFERFMELALYHPEHGYYASGNAVIGKDGDYYTSPHLSPLFGRVMVEVFLKLKAALKADRLHFVEVGGGEGHFAKDFIGGLYRHHHREIDRCAYVMVEQSDALVKRQKETLGRLASRVSWHRDLGGLDGPVTGVIFSNELMDALPFHRVRHDSGSLSELYVDCADGELVEVQGKLSTPQIARHLNRLRVTLPEGMTTEVNLRAPEMIRAMGDALSRGFVLTVDYGYPAGEYYSPERRTGTMLCYHRHKASERPYENIGEQDITAHADFSSLAEAGKDAGLRALIFKDQTRFFMDSLAELEGSMRRAGASDEEMAEAGRGLMPLVHPDWMGSAFKVLLQGKGVDDVPGFDTGKNEVDSLRR